jgi:hypothetical protein
MAERWKKLQKKELHKLYSSPNTVRIITSRRMGGKCSTHWGDEKFTQTLIIKTGRKEPAWKT